MEAALFVELFGDPQAWTRGPNGKSSPCNDMELDQTHDHTEPWLWLSGGTDWQGFQGGFRSVSAEGIRPTWVAFRVRIATPELSGAFLTLSSAQRTWGLADPILAFSYRGDEGSQNRRCFSVQTGAFQTGDVSHNCQIAPEVTSSKPYDIAVHLDWSAKAMSVFIDGVRQVHGVPFKAENPIRFAAIYNWRSGARTAFSEMLLGHDCPFALLDPPASVKWKPQVFSSSCPPRLQCHRRRLATTQFIQLAISGSTAALLVALAAQQVLSYASGWPET
jgi:hypothetical protein